MSKKQRMDRLVKLERLKRKRLEYALTELMAKRDKSLHYEELLRESLNDSTRPLSPDPEQRLRNIDEIKRAKHYSDTVSGVIDTVRSERAREDEQLQSQREKWLKQKQRGDALQDIANSATRAADNKAAVEEQLEIDDLPKGRRE